MSIAGDSPEAWKDSADQYEIQPGDPLLSDPDFQVSNAYDVMRWQAATGEPGHTFVLVDQEGRVAWVKDYGAPENGGLMYVLPDDLLSQLKPQLQS